MGEGTVENLSWHGAYAFDSTYPEGSVVTHEGSTWVALVETAEAPQPRCEGECAWTTMAVSEPATISGEPLPPPPPATIEVFEYEGGYDGPLDSPINQLLGLPVLQIAQEYARVEQEVKDWLAKIAPWTIRHRSDKGTLVGQRSLAPGTYVLFARGVFVSMPGLGKNAPPQSVPAALTALMSGSISSSLLGPLGSSASLAKLNNLARGPSNSSKYGLACGLSAGGRVLDTAALTLGETETASATLMAVAILGAAGNAEVSCAHDGTTAGPFVRDLRLVAVKVA